jgi:hypothetical protein
VIEPEQFSEGLTRIGLSVRQAFTAEEQLVYYEALGPQTDAAEWSEFTRAAVATGRWPKFLPTVAELLDALREFRGAPPLEAEAVAAYERVLELGVYTAEGGTTWNFRRVRELCGAAAARAFMEAGGNAAFTTTWNEAKRRERFVAAYLEAGRDRPAERLLPEGSAPAALPAGDEPALTEHEARRFMKRIRELAGEPEKPKPKGDGVVRATDDRLAELRAQADEITDKEPA